jgi:hypothetical protein
MQLFPLSSPLPAGQQPPRRHVVNLITPAARSHVQVPMMHRKFKRQEGGRALQVIDEPGQYRGVRLPYKVGGAAVCAVSN